MNEGEATDLHKTTRNNLKFVVALTLLTIICVGSLVQEYNFGSEDSTSSIFIKYKSLLLSKNISTKTTSNSTSTIAADDRIVCSTATNENENVTCIDPVGLHGEWVHIGRGNNRSFDSPECCGWADRKQTINDIILGEEKGKCNMNITKYWRNPK